MPHGVDNDRLAVHGSIELRAIQLQHDCTNESKSLCGVEGTGIGTRDRVNKHLYLTALDRSYS